MAVQQTSDTIAAVATPPGTGGIGIIRISGPEALGIMERLFKPYRNLPSFASHTMHYGAVIAADGRVLDEVLAVYMRSPNTYTREDVVELQSHGSYLVLNSILAEVIRNGARPAEPGEFTKRAFLAGRIDLTQAEAVIDLLQAKTDTGLNLAVGQLQGEMHHRIERIRDALVDILAVLEVAIDFPDDDVELIDREQMLSRIREEVERPLAELIALSEQGKVIRDGIHLVIAGLPNVGKSSLLNALLQEERALVTPVPGTTRDTIEEFISIRGVPARLVDTAGIREHAESVEEMGIQRARRKMREADLVLFLVDASTPFTEQDRMLYESIGDTRKVVVLNKIDIAAQEAVDTLARKFYGAPVVRISAKRHRGLPELQEAIYGSIIGEDCGLSERCSCAPNVRHRTVLEQSLAAAGRLQEGLRTGVTADLAAVEVQAALDHLGDIVGLTTADDVLDRI
ncbi:MAG TPA: tRNA uridine-5-carboxymethylaminomethyl(34) synthesis GTPase MnmE, partial [Desulfobacteraceae bacterium]|nr:tRNA uridine-5-carboxymethylaminomethyl(34) synthesis GTPase MnmE [Desulfobacteraceae bacterium]